MRLSPWSSLTTLYVGIGAFVAIVLALAAGEWLQPAWPMIVLCALLIGMLVTMCTRRHLQAQAHSRSREEERLLVKVASLYDAGAIGRISVLESVGGRSQPLQQIDVAARRMALLRQVAEGIYGVEALFDTQGRLSWITPSIERLTGHTPEDCLAADNAIALLVHESDRRYCLQAATQVLESGGEQHFEMRLARRDGGSGWVACRWRQILDDGGVLVGVRMSAEDIQARKETEYKLLETVAELRRAQALREHYLSRSNDERQRMAALLNLIRLGILFIDRDHRVLYFNRAVLEIWGHGPEESPIGFRDVVLQSRVLPLVESPDELIAHIRAVLESSAVASEPHETRLKDGRIITDVSAVVAGGEGRGGIGRVWIYEDVTEQHRIAEQLVALAERDPLTNLYNRRRFHEELERQLAEAKRHGGVQVGLVAIDLDGFKPINDRFGHQAGDEVLVKLAEGVGRIIRRNEMFFRVGGDEFCVLVSSTNERELSELASRLVEGVGALRFTFEGEAAGVTASIGIALYPMHADGGEELIAAADEAMYRSKNGGRNRWTVARPYADGMATPAAPAT